MRGEGEEEEEEEEERERERGGTTGGTYCQVGPRGVARVAPLSDSTHKREVGKNVSSGQWKTGRQGGQRRRGQGGGEEMKRRITGDEGEREGEREREQERE